MHEDGAPTLPTNQSRLDRAVRIGLAIVLFSIGVSGMVGEPAGGALRIASLFPFALGAIGWCPLYEALGVIRSKSPKRHPETVSSGAAGS